MWYERPLYSPLVYVELFLVIISICVKNHVLFLLNRTISCKKYWHKQFFLKTVELWFININVVWKATIVPLIVCRAFFSYNLYLRDKSRSFFARRTIFCKKCWHKQFFHKTVDFWELNINVVWKTTIVSLSVYRAFLVITCICVTSHVLHWLNMVNFFQEILT